MRTGLWFIKIGIGDESLQTLAPMGGVLVLNFGTKKGMRKGRVNGGGNERKEE
jgi:hypothetical protein